MARRDPDLVIRCASALSGMAVVAVVAAGHLALFPRVADLDAFYHIGHAAAYLEGSFFDTSLPWATQSVIGDVGGDLWWGFHVLLAPLAAVAGVEWAVRSGALVLTLLLALAVALVLRRHAVTGVGWWAALFFLAVPNVFYRHLMMRPHVLSLGISIVLVSVLVRGRGWHVALLCLALAWVHLNLAWLGPALVVAYAVARIPVLVSSQDDGDRSVPPGIALPAAVVGAVLGWLLRPDALATLSLLRIQLVEVFEVQALDMPLTFAAELTPIGIPELARSSGLFLLLWIGVLAVVLLWEARALRGSGPISFVSPAGRERRALLLTALSVSAVFFLLTLLVARRAMVQWVSFGFLALPLLWEVLSGKEARAPEPEGIGPAAGGRLGTTPAPRAEGGLSRRRRLLLLVGLALLLPHLGWFAWRHALNVEEVAFRGSAFSEVAAFLEEHSEPGEIAFHARWDHFGPLFAHNRENRYLGGMDPIFLHAHDPEAYWEFFYLSSEWSTEVTCDAFPCQPSGSVTDTHQVLTDHFEARWIVVEPFRNPLFSLYLLNDPRYAVAFETQREAVFEILTEPPTASMGAGGGAPGPRARPGSKIAQKDSGP